MDNGRMPAGSPNITTPLLANNRPAEGHCHNPTLVKTLSFGLNSLFLSTHILVNGRLLSLTGPEGPGAGAIVATYYSVTLGTAVGILLATGLQISPLIGKRKYIKAGQVIRTSWLLTAGLGTAATALMLANRGIFPRMFAPQTAVIAAQFFEGYAGACIPLLMIITNSQIAFAAGDWLIPPISGLLFAVMSSGISYGLLNRLGALGIGLGGTLSAATITAATQLWFLRPNYQDYQLYRRNLPHLLKKIKRFLQQGWRLSFQRLTEWVTLLLIATLLGLNHQSDALTASQPSIQYLALIASTIQGFAQAVGMRISTNRGGIQAAIRQGDKALALELHRSNVRSIILGNIIAASLNTAITFSFYLARGPLVQFFIPESSNTSTIELAETLLWINIAGLVSDGLVVVGAGALRGWDDILLPTLYRFIMMIIVGIPTAWGLSEAFGGDNEAIFMFAARDIAMLLSTALIMYRCVGKIREDKDKIDAISENTDDTSDASSSTYPALDVNPSSVITPNQPREANPHAFFNRNQRRHLSNPADDVPDEQDSEKETGTNNLQI